MSSSDECSVTGPVSDDEFFSGNEASSKFIHLTLEAKPSKTRYERRKAVLAGLRDDGNAKPQSSFFQWIDSPSTWSSAEVSYETFTFKLSHEELSEIEAALEHFKEKNYSLDNIGPSSFPLHNLGEKLQELSQQLYYGSGVINLRGLNPDDYSMSDNATIFAGVASYLSEGRGFQNLYDDHLLHMYQPQGADPTPNYLPFHNDSCEILSLFCIEPSTTGGRGLLASASQAYNELVSNRPEVLKVLMRPDFPFENPRVPGTSAPRPILFMDSHQPFFYASRIGLSGAAGRPRPKTLPQVTLEQADAIDALHFAAEKHAINAEYGKGDIVFLNNFTILHGREEYSHHSETKTRHLLRLWLRDRRFPFTIPTELSWKWKDVYDPSGGRKPRWNFDKERDYIFPQRFKYLITDEGEQGSKTEYRY